MLRFGAVSLSGPDDYIDLALPGGAGAIDRLWLRENFAAHGQRVQEFLVSVSVTAPALPGGGGGGGATFVAVSNGTSIARKRIVLLGSAVSASAVRVQVTEALAWPVHMQEVAVFRVRAVLLFLKAARGARCQIIGLHTGIRVHMAPWQLPGDELATATWGTPCSALSSVCILGNGNTNSSKQQQAPAFSDYCSGQWATRVQATRHTFELLFGRDSPTLPYEFLGKLGYPLGAGTSCPLPGRLPLRFTVA